MEGLEKTWKDLEGLESTGLERLVLHQNGVEFCQQFNGAIKNSLTASFIQDCF